MKKVLALCMAITMLLLSMGTQAFAAVDQQDTSDIEIGAQGGKEIELVGHIEPTIISVTMPSYIPFDISRSVTNFNKVVSPKISVQNNGWAPVSILVDRAQINLKELPGVSWCNYGWSVGENQIAIGFANAEQQPTTLEDAKWIVDGQQSTHLLDIARKSTDYLFIVGDLGSGVPENKTFSVIPTLVVKPAI